MAVGPDTVDQIKNTLIDLAIRFGPKLLAATVIMVVGVFVSRWVARVTIRGLRRFELEPPMRALFTRIAQGLVIVLFVIMALQNLGVELLPLIAGLGVAGAGVALATQGVLGNVVAGLTIIFTKPYRIGEYIGVAGVEGQVTHISLFSSVLTHPDHSRVVIPNRKVVGEILHNYGRIRQVETSVGIAYGSDLAAALESIRGIVTANARVLKDPTPLIQVTALGDSAIHVAVKPWVAVTDSTVAIGELNVAIVRELQSRGIAIPFPQTEVRLLNAA
jgi:small conductance mechanosensitive channel